MKLHLDVEVASTIEEMQTTTGVIKNIIIMNSDCFVVVAAPPVGGSKAPCFSL